MSRRFFGFAAVGALALWSAISPQYLQGAEPVVDLAPFVSPASFGSVDISPDGKSLAVTAYSAQGRALIFFSLDDMSKIGAYGIVGEFSPSSVSWVSNTRVVFSLRKGESVTPGPAHGALFAVDLTGRRLTRINSENLFTERQVVRVLDPLVDEPEWAIIESNHASYRMNPHHSEVFAVNVYSGAVKWLTDGPGYDWATVSVNSQGKVLMAQTYTPDFRIEYHTRANHEEEWIKRTFSDYAMLGAGLVNQPGPAGSHYLLHAPDGERLCLAQIDNESINDPEVLACHHSADISAMVSSFDGEQAIAAIAEAERPEYLFLNTGHPDEKRLKALVAAFKTGGQFVRPVSSSADGSRWILHAYSDRNPGDFYLYESDSHEARFLFTARPEIHPERMAPQAAAIIEARDGAKLPLLLTRPDKDTKVPLVVMPHGGPIGIRDRWGWNGEAQALAAHGYAVLQPNFRGSGGYGAGHLDGGRHAYGTRMIDDIVDATEWAIEEQQIDPERICISGASYGGYAALMAAIKRPDLYRCVITTAGVYDLRKWSRYLWAHHYNPRSEFVETFVGSRTLRKEQSPSSHIKRLQAPVLIFHGSDDERVASAHAKSLAKDLRRLDRPHELHIYEDEGHGGWSVANSLDRMQKLIDFLDEHLEGPNAERLAGNQGEALN